MRLLSIIEAEATWRKIMPCEYQSNPSAKFGVAEPAIR